MSRDELPRWRRALATAMLVLSLGAYNHVGSLGVAVFFGIAVPAVLMHVRATWAQLAVRACVGTTLLLGMRLVAKPFGAPAAAVALLSLGLAGLDGDDEQAPFRGVLHALVIVSGAQLLLLAFSTSWGAGAWSAGSWLVEHPRRMAFELFWMAVIAGGLVGLYRQRVWGVMLHGVGTAGLAWLAWLGFDRVFGWVLLPLRPGWVVPLGLVSGAITIALVASLLRRRGLPIAGAVRARIYRIAVVLGGVLGALRHMAS